MTQDITPEMIEAAADVIQGRAGDEWTTIDWAMSIAEAALEAAFDAKKADKSSGMTVLDSQEIIDMICKVEAENEALNKKIKALHDASLK